MAKFSNLGYLVRAEIKHQFSYPEFILGHWFDLVAIKNKNIIIIEVKPKDHEHNKKQYACAQLLANSIYDKYVYFVYEYNTGELIPKPKPNFQQIIGSIQEFVQEADIELPIAQPSSWCTFCPYSNCEYHPQYTETP